MRRVVLVVQVVLGLYFVAVGLMHFVVPDGLPEQMEWMYDLPTWTHWVSGAAEVAGGLGLLLPRLTQVRRELEPLAAAGLVLVMLGAVVYHASRGEAQNIVFNLVLAGLLGWIAAVRWRGEQAPVGTTPARG